MDLGPPELIIILVVILVLFGGAQLPKLARNLGKAQQEFKAGLADIRGSNDPADESKPSEDNSSTVPTDPPQTS